MLKLNDSKFWKISFSYLNTFPESVSRFNKDACITNGFQSKYEQLLFCLIRRLATRPKKALKLSHDLSYLVYVLTVPVSLTVAVH